MTKKLAFQIELPDSYEIAVEKTIAALKTEGFGVLTRIDMRATLKEKIDVDFRPYVILGACNPPLANQALNSDPLSGLLLPCSVTVEEAEGGALVSIVNPEAMLMLPPLADNADVISVAKEARTRLEHVAQALRTA